MMRFTFAGTGTSMGVPLIGCDCPVCRSDDPKDRRLRCGGILELDGRVYLIDAAPDLRQQLLNHRIRRLDGVLITHPHADHVFGLDDTRIFTLRSGRPLPLYASPETCDQVRRLFWYAFEPVRDDRLVKPSFDLQPVRGPFTIEGRTVVPITAHHGEMPVTGFRIGNFAYLTDFNRIDPAEAAHLRGVDTLVLGALRYTPSATHLTIPQAVAVAREIGAATTWLTHFTHEVSHRKLATELPDGIRPAWDGLRIDLDG